MQGSAKERFNEIQQELSQLSTKFSNNLLDATKAYKKLLKDPAEVSRLSSYIQLHHSTCRWCFLMNDQDTSALQLMLSALFAIWVLVRAVYYVHVCLFSICLSIAGMSLKECLVAMLMLPTVTSSAGCLSDETLAPCLRRHSASFWL